MYLLIVSILFFSIQSILYFKDKRFKAKEFDLLSLEDRKMYFIFFRYQLNPLSAFVRFFINLKHHIKGDKHLISWFNHIGLLAQPKETNDWFVYESSGGLIRKVIFSKRAKNRIIGIYSLSDKIPKNEFSYESALSYAEYQVGRTMYDTVALLFHQLVFQITGEWIGASGSISEEKQYCSEYTANIFNAGHRGYKFHRPHLTDPEDIINSEYLSEKPIFVGRLKKCK